MAEAYFRTASRVSLICEYPLSVAEKVKNKMNRLLKIFFMSFFSNIIHSIFVIISF